MRNRSTLAWNDDPYRPTIVERRHPFLVTWALLSALITLFAGVSTIWSHITKAPAPIVVQVPVLEHQAASPPRIVTRYITKNHYIVKKVPVIQRVVQTVVVTKVVTRPVYIVKPVLTAVVPKPVTSMAIGLSGNSAIFSLAEDENGTVTSGDPIVDGAIKEATNVTIVHGPVLPRAILLHTYVTDFLDNNYGEEFKLNVDNLRSRGYHRLTFYFGCADGKDTTPNAQADLQVTNSDTGTVVHDINQNPVDIHVTEGQSLGRVTLDLTAPNTPHVLRFQTSAIGNSWQSCSVALVNMTASK